MAACARSTTACLVTSARTRRCPSGCWRSTRCVDELIALHEPALRGRRAAVLLARTCRRRFAVGQARGVVLLAAAQHGVPVREATPNEVKIGHRGLRRGRQGAGPADGPGRPRRWPSGRGRTMRPTRWRSRSGSANTESSRRGAATAGVHGSRRRRADHARRDGLRARRARGDRPRAAPRPSPRSAPRRRRRVIASVEGVVGGDHGRFAGHRGRRDRVSGVRGAGDPRLGRSRAAG